MSLQQRATVVLTVALPLSLTIFTYLREIVPLYGLQSTTKLLEAITFAAVFFSSVQPFPIPRKTNLILAALAFTLAPNATYWIALWTARRNDPVWGPAVTHASVLAPLTFLLTSFVVDPNPDPAISSRPPITLRIMRGIMTYFVSISIFQRIWSPSSIFNEISGNHIFLSLAAILYSLWISFSNKKTSSFGSKRKAAFVVGFLVLWYKIHPLFCNPVLSHPLPSVYVHPGSSLRILSSEQSVTGLITVAERLPTSQDDQPDIPTHSIRYLRASHSLLGGVWMGKLVETIAGVDPIRDLHNNPLGDSIYGAFILQEASLLVNNTKPGKEHRWESALIIGLGVGISANTFMRHKIPTTIVEIDPAVYTAARKWFGLPDPGVGRVFLQDARSWMAEKRASITEGKQEDLYDIVVHDLFSGGGIPEHLYTAEFWNDLSTVMAPGAVLVVNYVGIINSESSRLVVNTLERKVGRCRAYHDSFDSGEGKYDTELMNMVLFCSRSLEPLTFRSTIPSDWFGSPLRRFIFQSLESREVNLDSVRTDDERYILTDENNVLGKLQDEQSSHHWKVMREVLSNVDWETY